MKLKPLFLILCAGIILLTGCENTAKMGADAAIKAGEEAFAGEKENANNFVPEKAGQGYRNG